MGRRKAHILQLIKKIAAIFLLVYFVVPFQYFQYLPIISPVDAATNTLTSRADFNTGKYIGTESKTKEGEIKLTGDGMWNARAWKTPNLVLNDQSAIVSDGSYIYLRPAGDNEFTRYLPAENRWQTLANAPLYAFPGADMVYLNGAIYSSFGGYQKEFKKYTIGTNTWSDIADLPDLTYAGSALVTDGTYIYAFRGSNTTDFWRYNVATDRWSVINSPPATIGAGGSLSYSGGYLYATRGASTQTFYRYDIGAGTWSTMTNVPATIADDTSMDVNGNFIYLSRGQATTTLYRYSISGNSWATLAALPQAARYVGNVYNADDGYMYVFRGNGTQDFWKYNIGGDSFVGPSDLPVTPGTGADLINVGTNLFYLRGNTSTALYKLDTTTNTWSALLAASPATFADDTKGASAGASLYFMRGSATQSFYSYSTGGNTWATLTNTPATVGAGGALAYPGTGDYIYGTRGGNTTGFWRYSIAGNSWDDVGAADLPATNAAANVGSRLVSDGTDIYYIAGNGVTQILKYTVGSNTWSVLGSMPFTPYYGTDMSYSAGKLYFQSGLYKPDFWEYTIAGGTWRRLPDIETTFALEQGPYNGGSLENNGGGTFYTISGQNILYMHSFTRSATNYPTSGTWTSGAIDLTYVTSWTSLTSSVTTPGDSSVTYESRTSSDRLTWTSWVAVSGGTISSATNRYIQIRATLNATSDKTQTPTLSSVSINYSGDISTPTNPSSITAKSQSVSGVTLTDSTSYSYTNPYFTWSGASDADTSVAGYYVYFGTSSSADPASAGSYQTGNTYTVTTPLSNNTYYLRIKTKDLGGNISNATTLFTYIYSGITAQSVTATTTSDFATGTLTNVSNSSNQLQLSSKAGFWLQQRLSLAPATISNNGGMAYVSTSGKLYAFRGGGTNTFYEYVISTDTWNTKAVAPATVATGATLIEGPAGYLYALRGGATNTFWRYDINADSWSDAAAADAPQVISTGATMIYDGSRYIYALAGNNDDAFYQYDTVNDSWTALANTNFGAPTLQPTNVISAGAAMAYDGASTIYVVQGSVTGSGYYNTGFATYNISTGSWTQLTNLPATSTADGAQIQFDSTSNAVYYIPANGKVSLYKYDLSSSSWSQLSDGPATFGAGASMRNVGGNLYILRGNGQQQLYTYNIAKASWQVPTMGLFSGFYRGSDVRTFATGAEMVKGSGNYYYISRGAADDLFVRYDSSTGEVVQLANIPAGMTTGSHFAYDSVNNKIYSLANTFLQKWYVYDVATDAWSEITADALPALPGAGSALEYDGARYIYYLRGNSTTALYRYDTQASAGSRWSALLAAAPGTIGAGGDLVFKGSYLYATRGNTSVSFYRYDPSNNTWSDPAVADFAATNNFAADGFIVDGGGDYIYGCRANNTATCYQYSVTGNTWTQIANAPANFTSGASGASNKSDKFYAIAGGGTNTFSDGLYTYIEQTSTSSFQETGTFQSASHDLSSVYKFANISLTYTSATNATFVVSTRTSADNSTFSSWAEATEEKLNGSTYTYKINSPVNRYIQVKITLTSGNGMYTSTVSDYTISYYQDTVAPTNPSSLSSYSTSTQSASISTNTWYNYAAPNFTWPAIGNAGAASDGVSGSGISGYYVYFGTDSAADPQSLGTLQTGLSYTASSLVSGSTYYLRVKAVDNANNLAATTWQPFIYKYDSEAPTNPTTIVADPPGYTNTNSFNFSWSGATDSGSLLYQYCYKTGASGAVETCTSSTSVSGVSAYQTGANAFYVRAKDNAGNIASTFATASYYYSSTAPSAPTSLNVSPATNTVNQFSFTWNPPAQYSGSQAGLRYYYSVNALPTSSNVNTVGLSTTYLTSGSYATQPGRNTLYVVAKDEAGNIDYNVYASVDFTADTSSPGIPRNMDIADVSTKSTSSWKLAISWNAPEASGSGVASYKVYQSITSGASCSTGLTGFTNVASTTGTSYVDADITQSTHYYCVKACDSTNNCSAASDTVSLYPDGKWTTPPDLLGETEVAVKTKSGIVTWSTSRTSNSFVKYGTKSGDYGAEVGSSDQLTSHNISLTGLNPGTKYYYKVLWTDEDGNTGESSEQTFTTEAAPFISSVKITDVGLYSAYVNFAINHTSSVKIEYGKTVNYGSVESLSTSTSEITQSIKLEDLVEGTMYHLRITAEDEEGNTFAGDDYTFETLPVPKVVGLKVQQVVGLPTATLRLVWSSNTLLSSIVTYYPTASPEKTKDQISLVLKKNHEIILRNLSDETEYTIIVKGKDAGGNEAVSPVQKVKTAADVRPPEIQNTNIETTVSGVGDSAKAQIIASWDTDESSTTQIEYGEGTGTTYGSSTQEDPNLTANHSVTIPSLLPSKIYHLRIVSKDKGKNIGYSEDIVIITPNATKDALNLVVNKLSKTFGFLKSSKLFK